MGATFGLTAAGNGAIGNPSDSILDIREYDVPYYLRVAIDKGKFLAVLFLRILYSLTFTFARYSGGIMV